MVQLLTLAALLTYLSIKVHKMSKVQAKQKVPGISLIMYRGSPVSLVSISVIPAVVQFPNSTK